MESVTNVFNHKYESGAVPPVALAIITPLFPPKQLTFMIESTVSVGRIVLPTLTIELSKQPTASVTRKV